MKHVIFIRHASAMPGQFPARDFERELDASGLQEAAALGVFMAGKLEKPEILLFSPAARTAKTAMILNNHLNIPKEHLRPELKLYNCHFQTLIHAIQSVDNQFASLVIVAHNPGISQSAALLSSGAAFQLAPAAAVCLAFSSDDWSGIRPGSGKEIWYFNP